MKKRIRAIKSRVTDSVRSAASAINGYTINGTPARVLPLSLFDHRERALIRQARRHGRRAVPLNTPIYGLQQPWEWGDPPRMIGVLKDLIHVR